MANWVYLFYGGSSRETLYVNGTWDTTGVTLGTTVDMVIAIKIVARTISFILQVRYL